MTKNGKIDNKREKKGKKEKNFGNYETAYEDLHIF